MTPSRLCGTSGKPLQRTRTLQGISPRPDHGNKISGFLPFRGTANTLICGKSKPIHLWISTRKQPRNLGSKKEAGSGSKPLVEGSTKGKADNGIDPRVIHAPHGWWFPEQAGPDHGLWQSNANVLTRNGPPYDPAMGTYQLRALLCRIYKEEWAIFLLLSRTTERGIK